MPQEVLLTAEAAQHVKLSQSSLEKARVAGTGPIFIKLGSRKVGYLRADLDRWLETRRRSSTSDTR